MLKHTKQSVLARFPILFVMLFFLFAVWLDSFTAFSKNSEAVRGSVLRLHILANSDAAEDQRIKLLVRDAILKETGTLFESADGRADAIAAAEENIQTVKEIAENKLASLGVTQSVQVKVARIFFETRHYENFTLPAGTYDAVQVILGEGAGQNWWCVLYPPLCLPAAVDREQFTEAEWELITSPRYEVHFYLLELFEKLKRKLMRRSFLR